MKVDFRWVREQQGGAKSSTGRTVKALTSIIFLSLSLSFTAYAGGDKCSAVTKKGTPCSNYAQKGAKVCYVHNPANQCEGKTKAGEKCKAMKAKGSKFCSRHGEQK